MKLIPYPGREGLSADDERPAGLDLRTSVATGDGITRTLQLLEVLQAAVPGGVAHGWLRLNGAGARTHAGTLHVTDLVGASGDRIPAAHIRVSPNPVGILAAGATDVQIEIRIPSQTPAGRYTGLLQAGGGATFQALVQVEVAPGTTSR